MKIKTRYKKTNIEISATFENIKLTIFLGFLMHLKTYRTSFPHDFLMFNCQKFNSDLIKLPQKNQLKRKAKLQLKFNACSSLIEFFL